MMAKPTQCPPRRRAPGDPEAGATLLIALMLLVVMAMLSVNSSKGTIMEEKMAGAQRDQNVAFQAAETGLRDAEKFVEDSVAVTAFSGSGGLLGEDDDEPDYRDHDTWGDSTSHSYTGSLDGVAAQPRFIVKLLGEIPMEGSTGSMNIGRYGQQQGGGKVYAFRITAQGTGASSAATAIVQSYYGKSY